ATPAWVHIGENTNGFFGYSIASGDFNHDGYSDVLIGAPNSQDDKGRIYLFLGSAQGLSDKPTWVETGKIAEERLGSYVANAGDVNGDVIQDVIVGAPNN